MLLTIHVLTQTQIMWKREIEYECYSPLHVESRRSFICSPSGDGNGLEMIFIICIIFPHAIKSCVESYRQHIMYNMRDYPCLRQSKQHQIRITPITSL
jgi:hypothetical protein